MRLLSPRGAVVVLLAAALLTVTPVDTSTAAPARPAQVGLVSFVSASLTSTGATLPVDWADIAGATKYEVFTSTSYDGMPTMTKPTMTVTGSKATLSGLAKGRDYYVQVRAVSAGGAWPRSARVGHGTMLAEATAPVGAVSYQALSWNVCSNVCASIATRTKTINARIVELAPDLVGLQEASRYTTAPTGYGFVVNGQNDILVRSGQFTLVKKNASGATSGSATFARSKAAPGKGLAWAALKHRSGAYVLVVDAHLVVGTSAAQVAQREYEAGRLAAYVTSTLAKLKKSHGTLTDWTKAPVILLGDFNTNKSHTNDDTMAVLEKAGWYDAYDQARALSRQHQNSANPSRLLTPVIGVKWGDHVDKVLVRPSRAIVYSWQNAGKMASGKYVAPLGSDHHPVLVKLLVR